MTQFKEYKLVMGAEGGNKFAEDINKLISEGWQPIGGVSVIKSEPQKAEDPKLLAAGYDMMNKLFTFQAMVR